MAKEDKPNNFQGVVLVLSAIERIGYKKGDVIDYVMDGQDPGHAVWDDPNFIVVFIPNKNAISMDNMLEALYDDVDPELRKGRRKWRYDIDHIDLKGKPVWVDAIAGQHIKENVVGEIVQPDEVVIP